MRNTVWRAVVPCNRRHYAVSTSTQKLDGKGACELRKTITKLANLLTEVIEAATDES
jgi:hypothetical protein